MKKSIITLSLIGVLTLGAGTLAFATDSTNENSKGNGNKNSGSCVQQLVSEGKTFEDAKQEMLTNKYSRVDAAVERGTITKERGEEIKAEMKANSDSCTTPGENKKNHPGYGLNKGLNNKGNGNCSEVNNQ